MTGSAAEGTVRFVHANVRVRDVDASMRFYAALGFERRGRLQLDRAYNVYLGLPGDGDLLELRVNEDRVDPYDLGDGYGHVALAVGDLDAMLDRLAAAGILPERPPYHPGGRAEVRICFVVDPDGYRVELIDGAFETPGDPDPSLDPDRDSSPGPGADSGPGPGPEASPGPGADSGADSGPGPDPGL